MTEQDWFDCVNPEQMLNYLGDNATCRKLRLFDIASCRRVWSLITPEAVRLIDVLEQFVDGLANEEELEAATEEQMVFSESDDVSYCAAADIAAIAADIADVNKVCNNSTTRRTAYYRECMEQCRLLQCIFGNPFRPATIDPAWLTPDVTALAQAIYEARSLPAGTLDTTRLAILADALEEAGCNSDDILSHCRSDGPHVRGCWVVDLLLAKE